MYIGTEWPVPGTDTWHTAFNQIPGLSCSVRWYDVRRYASIAVVFLSLSVLWHSCGMHDHLINIDCPSG